MTHPNYEPWIARDAELLDGDGRRIGAAVDRLGVAVEKLGLWIQAQAAELRWRRVSAWRRWGS